MLIIDTARFTRRDDRAIGIHRRIGPEDLHFVGIGNIPEAVVHALRNCGHFSGSDTMFRTGNFGDCAALENKDTFVAIVFVERN